MRKKKKSVSKSTKNLPTEDGLKLVGEFLQSVLKTWPIEQIQGKWTADIVFRNIEMIRGTWQPVFPFNTWEELAEKLKKLYELNKDDYGFVCSIYIEFRPYGDKVIDD